MTVDDAYRLYLRAELAKLRHEGDARELITKGDCELTRLGVPGTSDELTAFFADQAAVDVFVYRLSDRELRELTACCGRWRANGVASRLARARAAKLRCIPTDSILVREAEPSLAPAFSRNGFRLAAVARDPEILAAEPYRSRTDAEGVELPICIASQEPGRPGIYRLVDGVHRAIQLYRNGERELELCVVA